MAENNKIKKRLNPFLWFIFAIVIPFIVVLSLVMIILNIAGIDVMKWANEKGNDIPVVASVVTTEDEATLKEKSKQLQEGLEMKNQEIKKLTQEVTDLEMIIANLEQELSSLKQKQRETTKTELSNTENIKESTKTIVKSYEEMDSRQAALILEKMEDKSTVVLILKEVTTETRGEILQEMDPGIAADLTQKLTGESY